MGIERIEHPFKRAINQVLIGDLLAVDVVFADLFHYVGEQLEARVGRVLLRSLRRREEDAGSNNQVYAQSYSEEPVDQSSFHSSANNMLPESKGQPVSLQGRGSRNFRYSCAIPQSAP